MSGRVSKYAHWWLSMLFLSLAAGATLAWANGWIIFVNAPLNDGVGATRSAQVVNASRSSLGDPQHFLQVFGGELEGSDGGEFGGQLIFQLPGGSGDLLLDGPVDGDIRAIAHLPGGVIAITGMNHLGFNYGAIRRVEQGEGGSVHVSLLYPLNGSPSNFRWTTQGDLAFDVTVRPEFKHAFFGQTTTRCFVLTKELDLRRQWCALIFDKKT